MAHPQGRLIPLVALLAGCPAGGGQYLRAGYAPPASVAVLPLDNLTVDLDAPGVVRALFAERLAATKGYRVAPLEGTDAALAALGVTDGGQLRSLDWKAVCRAAGADAAVGGEVREFGVKTTGFLNVRQVVAFFEMKDCRDGSVLWSAEGTGASSTTALSAKDALKAGLGSLAGKLAEKAARSPLREQTLDMVWNAIQFLPEAR